MHFIKASVLGNDFIIIDRRKNKVDVDVVWLADRKLGVGCDQVLFIDESLVATCKMVIYNSDGSVADACGNGSCAVAALIFDKLNVADITIETVKNIVVAKKNISNSVIVNLGAPSIKWNEIPLSRECDTLSLPIDISGIWDYRVDMPVAVNVGNPHVIFFCDDLATVDICSIGSYVENHTLFPKKTNVSVVQVCGNKLKMRVWERGVGETEACGTAASAALYAAIQKQFISANSAEIIFKNGNVLISFEDGCMHLNAKVSIIFSGELINEKF